MDNQFIAIVMLMMCFAFNTSAQLAEEKTAPFSAVKSEHGKTMIFVEGKWYETIAINNTPSKEIIDYCKRTYEDKWLKRFSEDLVEVMQGMDKPLPTKVKLQLGNNGTTVSKTVTMTKENRKAAWNYNNTHEEPKYTSQKEVVKKVDKATAKAVNLNMDKPFAFKSAKIEYTITGSKMFSGKETYYIDDYGKTVAIITDKPGLMGQKDNQTIIWKDNKTTQIDHVKKTWQTYSIRPKSTEPPTIGYSTETQRKQGGYVKKSNEAVAGKSCEVYEHSKMKVTYWLWKGIDLKIVNYSLGKNGYTRTATSVQEGVSIPVSILKIPDDYKKL